MALFSRLCAASRPLKQFLLQHPQGGQGAAQRGAHGGGGPVGHQVRQRHLRQQDRTEEEEENDESGRRQESFGASQGGAPKQGCGRFG